MDQRADEIISKACRADGLEADDIKYLLSFDEESEEASIIKSRAIDFGKSLVDGEGFIHAQIGVDSHACKENCRFCSFAAINKPRAEQFFEIDKESLRAFASFFSDQGANLVSLMSTAGLDFDVLLKLVEEARSEMNDDTILLVNGPDFSLEQTKALRSAGAQAAYHAVRLGEGSITAIDPFVRLRTIKNIHQAGLALMTGVEPVWEGVEIDKIVESIQLSIKLNPLWTGVCNLTCAQGTAMADVQPVSQARIDQIGAIVRLASGAQAPIGGVGGVVWVDAGADPRNRGKQDAFIKLEEDIAAAKAKLEERQWRVSSQKSSMRRCVQAVDSFAL